MTKPIYRILWLNGVPIIVSQASKQFWIHGSQHYIGESTVVLMKLQQSWTDPWREVRARMVPACV